MTYHLPAETLTPCPFCQRLAGTDGSISHAGNCEGLQSAGINKLQLHVMKANAEHWFERYRNLQRLLFDFKEALEHSHR